MNVNRSSLQCYSFVVRTVSDWNQLPAVVVEQENPAAFEAQLARCAPVRQSTSVLCILLRYIPSTDS